MFMVRIKLLGKMSFTYPAATARGYSCDVPQDRLGMPYISPLEILGDKKWPFAGVKMKRAHPEGYLGLIQAARELQSANKDSTLHIGSFFMEDRFDKKSMSRICSLKAEQTFFASVEFDKDKYEEMEAFLREIKRIGVEYDDITGEVECSLEMMPQDSKAEDLSTSSEYYALDYSMQIISPVCFPAPYNSEQATYLYAPGAVIRKDLCEKILPNAAEKLTVTNAYIMNKGERLFPMPLCMSVVKLDHEQLRYKLAVGKNIASEQLVNMRNAYTRDFETKLARYVFPEIVRIISGAGKMYDALAEGQILTGTIYGSDKELRELAPLIDKNGFFSIGLLTEEGYGEIYLQTVRLREKNPQGEILARRFDVACLSDGLIINDEGMPSYSAEDLLAQAEHLLGVSDKLMVEDECTDLQKDFNLNEREGAIVRCLKAGSVVRFCTKDKEPIDIAPILHTFVGERTRDGYGEIATYPARDGYYRLAKNLEPAKFATEHSLSTRDINLGAELIQHVLLSLLKKQIKFLAFIDKNDYQAGVPVEELLPTLIFDYLRNTYYPALSMETMSKWYRETLEEKDDVGDFA